jgi:hypothetical protein
MGGGTGTVGATIRLNEYLLFCQDTFRDKTTSGNEKPLNF